jgi:hypothetical protein
MPLVPAVTELIIAELLYLEKQGPQAAVEMLINSSGTTRQDGEIVGAPTAAPRRCPPRRCQQRADRPPAAGHVVLPPACGACMDALRVHGASSAVAPSTQQPHWSPVLAALELTSCNPHACLQLAFDSEGIAITATMGFVKNPVSSCCNDLGGGGGLHPRFQLPTAAGHAAAPLHAAR